MPYPSLGDPRRARRGAAARRPNLGAYPARGFGAYPETQLGSWLSSAFKAVEKAAKPLVNLATNIPVVGTVIKTQQALKQVIDRATPKGQPINAGALTPAAAAAAAQQVADDLRAQAAAQQAQDAAVLAYGARISPLTLALLAGGGLLVMGAMKPRGRRR